MQYSPAAESLLNEASVAVLATVDSAGRPHATPVWYFRDGSDFVVSTTRSAQKFRNIASNPDVVLVIERRTLPYFSVIVRGRAAPGAGLTDEELLGLAIRYYGETTGREYARRARAENEVTIRIRPSKIIEYAGETNGT
jgi:PPOX class probable F420-dependent enzyme